MSGYNYPWRLGRTVQGNAFVGAYNNAAASGTFPAIQFWNPSASGKYAVINAIYVTSETATAFVVGGQQNNTLQTGTIASPVLLLRPDAAISPQCFIVGYAPSTFTGLAGLGHVGASYAGQNILDDDEALILAPGYGFIVVGNTTAGVNLRAAFYWKEVNGL
jgi:hypothetical protein